VTGATVPAAPGGPQAVPSTPPTAGDVVTLAVPATTGYVGLVRSLAAGLAARLDLDLDHVEDLRLAVSEACAVLLPLAEPGARLEVSMLVGADGLAVDLATATAAGHVLAEDSFAWTVLAALADGVDSGVSGGVASIRIRFGPAEETPRTGQA
jgi:serine/threonine-protein kinase RsbW